MNFKISLLISTIVLLAACGGGKNPDKEQFKNIPESQKVGETKAEVLGGHNTLQFNNGALEGMGSVRIADVLEKADSANNFSIQFLLDAGGRINLVTNASKNLDSGIQIEISRHNKNLRVLVKTDTGIKDLSSYFASILPDENISLAFDIHNDHGDGIHFICWNEKTGTKLAETSLPGRGAGAFWGLQLTAAKIYNVKRAEARDER